VELSAVGRRVKDLELWQVQAEKTSKRSGEQLALLEKQVCDPFEALQREGG